MTGNHKLCKVCLKILFFQNVLVFIDLSLPHLKKLQINTLKKKRITSIISSTQIARNVMCIIQ